jgi:ubiquinone biosynthesis protein
VLLQKTLLYIEGLGRELYPELDLWETAKPFMERWMREQIGVGTLVERLAHNWPQVAERLPELPVAITRIVDHLDRQATARPDGAAPELQAIRAELRQNNRRTTATVAALGLAGCATALLVLPEPARTLPLLVPILATVLIAASLGLLWHGFVTPARA